jgi:hypothetical protein
MLIWKCEAVVISVAGSEVTRDMLSFETGKTRTVKYISGPQTTNLWIACYRTSEKVVDFDTKLLNTGMTLLPVSIPLKEGQVFRAGFRDKGAGAGTYNITVGYEETPD